MYTIAPVDDDIKVRQVHRVMLKAVLGVDLPGHASSHTSPPAEEPSTEGECSFDYDLLVLNQQPSAATFPTASATTSVHHV